MPISTELQLLLLWLVTLPATLVWGDRQLRNASLTFAGLLLACVAANLIRGGDYNSQIIFPLIEAVALALFLRLSLRTNRRFPLFLAAAALIGLSASVLGHSPVASRNLELLTLPHGSGLLMLIALWIATATARSRPQMQSHMPIAPRGSLR